MTLNPIPARYRNRHRGKTGLQLQRELTRTEDKATSLTAALDQAMAELTELREENVTLHNFQRGADDFFAILAHDVYTTNAAWQQEKERRETFEKELAQAEDTIRLRDQKIADLERKVDVGVKAEHVIAKTQELDVSRLRDNFANGVLTLQQAHCIGPVLDPGHITR